MRTYLFSSKDDEPILPLCKGKDQFYLFVILTFTRTVVIRKGTLGLLVK